MLRILDRYVIKEVLAPFFLALSLFTFILLVDPLMREAQRLIEKGVGAWTILRILGTLMSLLDARDARSCQCQNAQI